MCGGVDDSDRLPHGDPPDGDGACESRGGRSHVNRRQTIRNATASYRCRVIVQHGEDRVRDRRGFSLTELLVVLSVAILLTGLLLPALAGIRENAHRIICASNERQQGMLLLLYAGDHDDELPYADPLRWDEGGQPQELMAIHHGPQFMRTHTNHFNNWDGLGILFQEGYCDSCDIFYCPSHRGDHPMERYVGFWTRPNSRFAPIYEPVYMNYHYAGDLEWESGQPRNLNEGNSLVLTTDGLRTLRDFNHGTGMNVLRGDGSVKWEENTVGVVEMLPMAGLEDPNDADMYQSLWGVIQDMMR